MKSKRYLLYAIGEILLIVIGILLALYINNRNTNQQYKKRIDNNIIRVYSELEKNIDNARITIEELRKKDSIVYLVLNDSLKAEDYYENIDFAFLIANNDQVDLFDKAYQNLIELNISENRYNDELLINLKELYSHKENIERTSDRTSLFITETSIPFLAKDIKSFADLTYREIIKEDALDFFLTSQEYKTYVSRYAIRAIRNQLTSNRVFYKKALEVYNQISKQYNLENIHELHYSESMTSKLTGKYIYDYNNEKDTFNIKVENDSLFIWRGDDNPTYLVPLEENRYFLDGKGQKRYFVSFFESDSSDWIMKIHLLTTRPLFKKVKSE